MCVILNRRGAGIIVYCSINYVPVFADVVRMGCGFEIMQWICYTM